MLHQPNIRYYAIFLLVSGVIHYVLCFLPWEKKKVKVNVVAAIKAAVKEKEKQPEKKPEKKPQKTVDLKKKKDKEELIRYRENLEQKLKNELINKLKKIEADKKKEIKEIKEDLVKDQQQKQKELEQAKKMQEQMSRELAKKLQEMTQQMEALKKQEQKQKKELAEKLKEVERKNEEKLQEKLTKIDEDNRKKVREMQEKVQQEQDVLQKRQKQLDMLARRQANELKKTKEEREKLKKQQDKSREDLEEYKRKIARAVNKRMRDQEKANREERKKLAEAKKRLEKEILQQKQMLENTSRLSKKSRRRKEREIINKQWRFLEKVRVDSLKEHQKYIQNFSTTSKGDVVVPALNFFDSRFVEDMQKVTSFHKMQLIAYPPQSMSYFIRVDLGSSGSSRYNKMTDEAYFRRFNERTIDFSPQVLPSIVREIKSSDAYSYRDGKLAFFMLLPHNTAKYLAWKQITVCKKYGYDPKNVRVCNSYFSRTRHGYWSLIVKSLVLKDGRTVSVEDFEERW